MLGRILTLLAVLCCAAGAAAADFKLTILHTNDFHSRFQPVSESNSTCTPEETAGLLCLGGAARMATAIAAARARSHTSLLLDGGDQLVGSDFYRFYKGAFSAEVMNVLGYDAMTLGNHEFDGGPPVLRGFLEAVDFPVLVANAELTDAVGLAGLISTSTVVEKAGERLGLIGVTRQDMHELSSPGRSAVFTNPAYAVQDEIDRLAGTGVNKIIVLSHLGYFSDKRLALETSGIDVIVGGHSHIHLSNRSNTADGPYPTTVGSTAIVQVGPYGRFLGELLVTFDDGGVVTAASGEPILLDADIAEDKAMGALIATASEALSGLKSRAVGETVGMLDGDLRTCGVGECALGNLVAEAMLERVGDRGIQIAVFPAGGLHASFGAGAVTMEDVLKVFPYPQSLSWFQVPGNAILEALEHGVSLLPAEASRFPQVAGLRLTIDPDAQPGARIVDAMVEQGGVFVPILPKKIYGVVSTNNLRIGEEGYSMFADAPYFYAYGPLIAEIVAGHLTEFSPYAPRIDGRISRE